MGFSEEQGRIGNNQIFLPMTHPRKKLLPRAGVSYEITIKNSATVGRKYNATAFF